MKRSVNQISISQLNKQEENILQKNIDHVVQEKKANLRNKH